MAELINLRRARKTKAKAEKSKAADANRAAHGIAKPVKKLAEARTKKAARRPSPATSWNRINRWEIPQAAFYYRSHAP